MNELIKIIENNGIKTVSARELFTFLESKQDFSDWIKNRIEKYRFVEGQDFTIILWESDGGRPKKEYFLSIDTAKELSMVENNEKGKQARQYFIECEKMLRSPDLQTAQMDKRLDRLEMMFSKMIESIPSIVSATLQAVSISQKSVYTQDYFSIIGFANNRWIKIAFSEAQRYGREAAKLSRETNIEIRKVPDERWGEVSSFHVSILNKIFEL